MYIFCFFLINKIGRLVHQIEKRIGQSDISFNFSLTMKISLSLSLKALAACSFSSVAVLGAINPAQAFDLYFGEDLN